MNSRFITYPSTVKKENNHTVVLIDANQKDVNEIGVFLTSSNEEFDIYIYEHDLHDLEFLNHIVNRADYTLINEASLVTVQNVNNQAKFGVTQQMQYPIEYFNQIDKQMVDKTVESLL